MDPYHFEDGSEFAKALDNNDHLGHFRRRFYLKNGVIYMCGNSLGLLSKDAEEVPLEVIEYWKKEGVKIWNVEDSKYYLYSNYVAQLMASIVGADEDEVIIGESTTTCIHQAISTFYKPTNEKYKILVDDLNFPSDRYAVDSQVRLKGLDPKEAVKVVKSADGKFVNEDDLIEAMTEDVAVVFLPGVLYKSAQVLDMKKVSDAAKEKGIIIGWDMCHAVGALEIDLKSLDVDFALWCTYKYLNGGPGSNAGLYINRRHFKLLPGLAGWYGNKKSTQFLFRQEFDHQQDAGGWQIGTPQLLSMAPLEGALKMFKEAGMKAIRRKSLNITAYLMFLVEKKLSHYGFTIGSFKEDSKRGGHVCLEHDEAYKMSIALKGRGVVPDFREPNCLRLAPTALYTSYEEVYRMVDILLDIVKTKSYEDVTTIRNFVV